MENTKLTIRNNASGQEIFDPVRKKFVALTPEELVRQKTILFLSTAKKYPLSLMCVELGLKLNGMQKRCDILVYARNRKPILIIECKAENVKISQDVFDQLARYNLAFKVPYLIATNALETYCCKIDFEKNTYAFLKEIPEYGEII